MLLLALGGGYWAADYYQTQQQQQAARLAEEARLAELEARAAAIEARKRQPVYIDLPGAERIRALVDDYDQPGSIWFLVNKERHLPLDYKPDNLAIPDVPTRTDKSDEERSVRQEIVAPLGELFAAAKTQGSSLMIGSAFRSSALQQFYFDSYVARSGLELANRYSAYPGQSEHQLGLAVDLSTLSQQCYLSACFINIPDGQWLANNAHKYGFTLRYKEGKEAITGYNFEPWHYRYVGVDLATALFQSGLTLEEAWPHIQRALDTLRDNGAI